MFFNFSRDSKLFIIMLFMMSLSLPFPLYAQTADSAPSDDVTQAEPSTEQNLEAVKTTNKAAELVTTKPDVTSTAYLARVMLGLLAVVVLIFAMAWFLRRFGQGTLLTSQHMRVLGSLPLGARERAVLVEVGGQQMLLGVTTTQINQLHVFESPAIDAERKSEGNSDFAQKMREIMSKAGVPGSKVQ